MARKPFVPASTHRIFGPGESCTDSVRGDLVLVRNDGAMAEAIRRIQRLRVAPEYCWCNHAAIVLEGGLHAIVSQEGPMGDVETPMANLGAVAFAVVHYSEITNSQRDEVARFARNAVGLGYGYFQIVADAFNGMTGFEFTAGWGDRMVCSTASCRALERAGLIADRSPYAVNPAHLARYHGVRLPQVVTRFQTTPSGLRAWASTHRAGSEDDP